MNAAGRSLRDECPALGSKISHRAAHLRETDCVAGHVRLELRNVVANYPFESSRGFPRSEPNSGHADHSRLSCSTGDTQLGLGSAGIFQQAGGTTSGPGAARLGDLDHSIAATAAPDRGTNIHRHSGSICCSSVGLLCPSTKGRVPAVSPCSSRPATSRTFAAMICDTSRTQPSSTFSAYGSIVLPP